MCSCHIRNVKLHVARVKLLKGEEGGRRKEEGGGRRREEGSIVKKQPNTMKFSQAKKKLIKTPFVFCFVGTLPMSYAYVNGS